LLAVPHSPEDQNVSILVIDGDFPQCYEWKPDQDHLNHRIRIKKSYGLDGNISLYYVTLTGWYAKLQWLRLPVLPIPEHQAAFEGLISGIEKSPKAAFAESRLDDYLGQMLKETVDDLVKKLRKISPSIGPISFEAVCERLVRFAGYEVVAKNRYDKLGGDFDLRCVRSRTSASPFESGDVNLFVQAKKYEGTTDEHAVQQLLKMMEKDPSADGCVMSLGDDYSPEAEDLAKQNNITLMNGHTICELLLKTLVAES
jgi:restriction endonuclease Mrr